MKTGIGILGGLLLALLCGAGPAAAQGLPQGSYLRSCVDASLRGDNLIAVCRRPDGREQRTSLAGVHRVHLPMDHAPMKCILHISFGIAEIPKSLCVRIVFSE